VRLFPIVGWAERGGYLATGHGNSVPRFHLTWGTGPGLVEPFAERVAAAVERGLVELRFRHRVDALSTTAGTVDGVRGSVLARSDVARGQSSSREVVGEFAVRAQVVVVTSGGIGGDQDLVRACWPARLGDPPRHMVAGVPAHVDGRMLAITERAGGRVINPDRMWHYTEGLHNWDPIWPGHGIRILPGPSSLWLDARGKRLPVPLYPGFDTLGTLSHILTFFEWEYGVLPYTKALAALLPGPLLPDQRTAALRFESPQHYSSSLAELRFPTGNRGGWLQGLEEFFHEHLVPGALITLSHTAEPHIFTLTYEEQAETTDRLLILDEKKNKLAFANVSYYSAVDEDMLVNQQQYGRLRNLKSLPMSDRRKADVTLEHVFETVGEPVGTRSEPRYEATPGQLYVALNVLRPVSREYLAHLLAEGDEFEQDGNRWSYTPPPVEIDEDEEQDEDLYDEDEE